MKKDKYRDYVAMSLRYHTVKRNEHLAMPTSTMIKSKERYLEKSGEKPQRLIVLEKVTLWMIYYTSSLLPPPPQFPPLLLHYLNKPENVFLKIKTQTNYSKLNLSFRASRFFPSCPKSHSKPSSSQGSRLETPIIVPTFFFFF